MSSEGLWTMGAHGARATAGRHGAVAFRGGRQGVCCTDTIQTAVIGAAVLVRGGVCNGAGGATRVTRMNTRSPKFLLDVPLVHGPDPVWSALQSLSHPVW